MITIINNGPGTYGSSPIAYGAGPAAYGPPPSTYGSQNIQALVGDLSSAVQQLTASLGASPFGASPFGAVGASPFGASPFGAVGASPFSASPFGGQLAFSGAGGPTIINNYGGTPSPFAFQPSPVASNVPTIINNFSGNGFGSNTGWVSPPILQSNSLGLRGPDRIGGHYHSSPYPSYSEVRVANRQDRLEARYTNLASRLTHQERHPEAQPHTTQADRNLRTAHTRLGRAEDLFNSGNTLGASRVQTNAARALNAAANQLRLGGQDIHAAHHHHHRHGWA